MSEQLKSRTAASFGYEWSKFNDVFPEYEDNFLGYVAPVDKNFFAGKTVLDAGCGAGRHTYFAARYGARVVAFDLSNRAVEAARKNTRDQDNVNIVQADIYHLPEFWRSSFDCVMSIGVLHHLPRPQAGFNKLVEMLKPGGTMLIWVYGRRDNWMAVNLYEPLRLLTTKMPHKLLYWSSIIPAMMVEMANRVRLPLFRHYRKFPFRTKWNDAFDVLSAPKAEYYRPREIGEWFRAAGMNDILVQYRILDGKAKGIRGMGTK